MNENRINDPAGAEQAELEPSEEIEDRQVVWPSPLLRKTKLDVPFDELEATT